MIEGKSFFKGPPREQQQLEQDSLNEINDSDLDLLLEDLALEEEISDDSMN